MCFSMARSASSAVGGLGGERLPDMVRHAVEILSRPTRYLARQSRQCPLCGDHGMIHLWEDTLWNRDAGAPPPSIVPPSTATH